MSNKLSYEELEQQNNHLKIKLAEKEKDNEEFNCLFSMTLDIICIADVYENKFLKINNAFTELLGYSENYLLSKTYFDFLHPDDIENTKLLIEEQILKGKPVYHFTNRYLCKNGSYKVLSWVSQTNPKNGLTYAVARDVTEQRKSDLIIQSQNQLMNTLLDNLQVGIFMIEAPSGRPLLANRKAKELLGRGITYDTDKTNLADTYKAYKVGIGDIYPAAELPIVRGLYGESCSIDDMVVVQPDGRRVFLEVFGSPIINESGKVTASIISFADITERIGIEKERKNLINDLKKAIQNIKTLSGLLPICSGCKKIRDDKGYWNTLEAYIEKHSDASFSHGMCTNCSDIFYGGEDWYIEMKKKREAKT